MEDRPYSLEVEALDLGPETRAVGLELVETESREPLAGETAARIWAALFPALAAGEYFVLDFFSHLGRVREFCKSKGISFREESARCLVIPQPLPEQLGELLQRFEGETFGLRAGALARDADRALEDALSGRGLDAYQEVYGRYAFCAVCELSDGWVTLLSEKLWASEVARRARPAVERLRVAIQRMH